MDVGIATAQRCSVCGKRFWMERMELTRFCGHLSIGDVSPPEGSPHGTNEATLYAGVPH